MARSIIYLKLEPVDGHPTRRRLIATVNHDTRVAELDITDAQPVERAISMLALREADEHLKQYIAEALNVWVRQELIDYLESTVKPHGYLQPMYDTIELIQDQYRAQFGGEQ